MCSCDVPHIICRPPNFSRCLLSTVRTAAPSCSGPACRPGVVASGVNSGSRYVTVPFRHCRTIPLLPAGRRVVVSGDDSGSVWYSSGPACYKRPTPTLLAGRRVVASGDDSGSVDLWYLSGGGQGAMLEHAQVWAQPMFSCLVLRGSWRQGRRGRSVGACAGGLREDDT